VPAVEALPSRIGTLPQFEELSGLVRARNQVAIHPEINGSVVEVLVRNGDTVERGQALVRLDSSRQLEQLRQAEAGLMMAEATAAEARAREAEVTAQTVRLRALVSRGLVSDLEMETREAQLAAAAAQAAQADARVGQARATVAERRSELDRATVRAPAAGRVGQREVEVGMVVNSSSTLFLLGDFNDLLVEVPLTQAMLADVVEGTPVEIEARDLPGDAMQASVSRISPFLEQSSFSTVAEIDLPLSSSGLRPGMFVSVRVLQGVSRPATLVPASAVWEEPRSGSSLIFVVEETDGLDPGGSPGTEISNQARRVSVRTVEVEAEGRGQSGVTGVDEGEWVVTVGQHLVYERMRATGADSGMARVRATSWEQVLELQDLQREDLLEQFLAKQRRVAEALGAEIPSDPNVVDELLQGQDAGSAGASDPGGS
jgi:RND family efflux transporter MFP subunit